ncbi:MAG: hypothetical protein KBS44_03260 [Clostridiales bacterium]|nr:hypothetical protein [Candidatus Coliplasma equi]
MKFDAKKLKNLTESELDEALDEYYRPKKMNGVKSLAPLFVYLILKECSSDERHLKQAEILKLLSSKYEIFLERKALGRILHLLADSRLFIYCEKGAGAWYSETYVPENPCFFLEEDDYAA